MSCPRQKERRRGKGARLETQWYCPPVVLERKAMDAVGQWGLSVDTVQR